MVERGSDWKLLLTRVQIRQRERVQHGFRERRHLVGRQIAVGIDGARQRVADRGAEAAGLLVRGGHRGEGEYALDAALTFIIEEVEQLVLLYGTAERGAELILDVDRLHVVDRLEETHRVQIRIAQVFPRGTVNGVGAALGGGVDHGSRGAPVLGAVVAGLHAELADRVRRQLDHLARKALVAGAVGVVNRSDSEASHGVDNHSRE